MSNLWIRFKMWVFIKLGIDLWKFIIFHEDSWKQSYGISFTNSKDWLKKVKYDMKDVEDLDKEMKK